MPKATTARDIRRGPACDYPRPVAEYERLQQKAATHPRGFRKMIETIAEKFIASALLSGLAAFIGIKIGVTKNEGKINGLEEKIETTERRLEQTLSFVVQELKDLRADLHEFRRDAYKPRWSDD